MLDLTESETGEVMYKIELRNNPAGRVVAGVCAVILGASAVFAQSPAAPPAGTAPVPPKAAAAIAKPAQMTHATPALWKVEGAHQTVYLFGTVHAMKPDVDWETPKVKQAFDKSDTLYLELANVNDMAAAQPLIMELGLDKEHPLSTKISKDDVALLDAAIKGMGQPMGEAALEPLKPWLAYVSLASLPLA